MGGKGAARGLRISHILSTNMKAEFCVVIGAAKSQLMSSNFKAEFSWR